MSKALGYAGEQYVAEYFRARGAEILSQNFTIQGGEVDLIVREKEEIVFVEVKTRRSRSFGTGAEAVDGLKIGHLIRAAQAFLLRHGYKENTLWRIDLVEVGVNTRDEFKILAHHENLCLD